jgi:hypothetical protein
MLFESSEPFPEPTAFHVTMQEPPEQITVHAYREMLIRKAIGKDLIALRKIEIRPYNLEEAQVNRHHRLDKVTPVEREASALFLRAMVMESSLRRADCEFCRDHAGKMKLVEHKRLPSQFWSGNRAQAYKVTLQAPFQEITVRSDYESSVGSMISNEVKRIRSIEIRPYKLNEPQTKYFCGLNNTTSEQHSVAISGLHLFVMEGSLRAPGCTSCVSQA